MIFSAFSSHNGVLPILSADVGEAGISLPAANRYPPVQSEVSHYKDPRRERLRGSFQQP